MRLGDGRQPRDREERVVRAGSRVGSNEEFPRRRLLVVKPRPGPRLEPQLPVPRVKGPSLEPARVDAIHENGARRANEGAVRRLRGPSPEPSHAPRPLVSRGQDVGVTRGEVVPVETAAPHRQHAVLHVSHPVFLPPTPRRLVPPPRERPVTLRNVREASRSRSSSSKVPQALCLGGPAADGPGDGDPRAGPRPALGPPYVHAVVRPGVIRRLRRGEPPRQRRLDQARLQRRRRSSQNAMVRDERVERVAKPLPRQPRLHPRDPVGVLAVRVPRARAPRLEHARDAPVFPRGDAANLCLLPIRGHRQRELRPGSPRGPEPRVGVPAHHALGNLAAATLGRGLGVPRARARDHSTGQALGGERLAPSDPPRIL